MQINANTSLTFYSPKELASYIETNKNVPEVSDIRLVFCEKKIKDFGSFIANLKKLKVKKQFQKFVFAIDQEEQDDEDEEEKKNKRKEERNKLQEEKIVQLFKYIQNLQSSLQELCLYMDGNSIRKGSSAIKEAVSNLKNLQEFKLSINENEIDQSYVSEILTGLSELSHLKKVQILADSNKLKAAKSDDLLNSLSNFINKSPSLEHIELSFSQNSQLLTDEFVQKMLQIFADLLSKNAPSLKHLELHFDEANIKGVEALQTLAKLSELRLDSFVVSLQNCKRPFSENQIQILRNIKEKLQQNGSDEKSVFFDDLRQEWDNFYELKKHLQQQKNEQNLKSFSQNREFSLSFPDQAIMPHDIKYLIEDVMSLSQPHLSLFDLDLSQNDLQTENLLSVFQLIKKCPKLVKLDLTFFRNQLNDSLQENCLCLETLKSFHQLEQFSLDLFANQELSDVFFEALAGHLTSLRQKSGSFWNKLQEFKLVCGGNEQISDKTCFAIIEIVKKALSAVENIQISVMSCSQVTKKGVGKIIECVMQNNANAKNIELNFSNLGLKSQDILVLLQHVKNLALAHANIHEISVEIDIHGNEVEAEEVQKKADFIQNKFPMIQFILEDGEEEEDEEGDDEEESN